MTIGTIRCVGKEDKKRSALYYVIEKEWLAEYKKLGEINEG